MSDMICLQSDISKLKYLIYCILQYFITQTGAKNITMHKNYRSDFGCMLRQKVYDRVSDFEES